MTDIIVIAGTIAAGGYWIHFIIQHYKVRKESKRIEQKIGKWKRNHRTS